MQALQIQPWMNHIIHLNVPKVSIQYINGVFSSASSSVQVFFFFHVYIIEINNKKSMWGHQVQENGKVAGKINLKSQQMGFIWRTWTQNTSPPVVHANTILSSKDSTHSQTHWSKAIVFLKLVYFIERDWFTLSKSYWWQLFLNMHSCVHHNLTDLIALVLHSTVLFTGSHWGYMVITEPEAGNISNGM